MHFFGAVTFLALIAACFVFARRFTATGHRGWAAFSAVTGALFLATWLLILALQGARAANVAFAVAIALALVWTSLFAAARASRRHKENGRSSNCFTAILPMRHTGRVRSSMFEVVVEPNRRRILDLLRDGDRSVNDLVDVLDIAQPTVSKHLKALREAGLVVVRPDAQRRWYQLRSEPLRELDAWLEPYRAAWSARFDALARHLDQKEEL